MNQMENKESIVIQREIINKAISYIFEHIDEDITVDDVRGTVHTQSII